MKSDSDHLNLGCGLNAPSGWLNVDGSWQVVLARHPSLKQLLVRLRLFPQSQASIPWSRNVMRVDLQRSLPFPGESFRVVYSSHTLEHLHYEDAVRLLSECYRILKPGGICRMVVPDLSATVQRYVLARQRKDGAAANDLMQALLVHDKARKRGLLGLYYRLTGYHQHKWMYDAESLKSLFVASNFSKVRAAGFLDSQIDRIAEVEERGRIADGQGVAVEGIKQ